MRAFFAFSLLLLVLAWTLPAQSVETAIVLTEEIQLKVANAFWEEGEYYRAVTEYKKFLIIFPASRKSDYALFRTALAYYRGEEYEASARTFTSLREKYAGSLYESESRYFEGLSYWKLKKYESARIAFESLAISSPGSKQAPLAIVANSLVFLDREDPAGSMRELRKLLERYPEYPGSAGAREALRLLGDYWYLPRKSEVLAGALSAVIPGSGYVYAGHFKDGVTAFVVNGLSIAGAATGIHQENYAVGAVAGGIGLPFYFGNIYGSANAAKKWNTAARNKLRSRIHEALAWNEKAGEEEER